MDSTPTPAAAGISNTTEQTAVSPARPRLLDELRSQLRVRNYAYRTEQVYADWVRRFILFHGKRHPRDMGAAEVTAFLSHLAVQRGVSASTQNQAKSAILFLYENVLCIDLPWLGEVVSAKVSRRLPVVLTSREVRSMLHSNADRSWATRTCSTREAAAW